MAALAVKEASNVPSSKKSAKPSSKENLKQKSAVPAHIGIIMDGNGRWAKKQSLHRSRGHLAGIDTAKRTLRYCIDCGVSFVTLYVFSTENWTRPKREISFIFNMVASKLKDHYSFYKEHSIRVVHSGEIQTLGDKLCRELEVVKIETIQNNKLVLNLAFNYGGRNEIIRAVNRYMEHHAKKREALTETLLAQYLDQPDLPFLDLIIRTGERRRLSNFLLWQSAYAELYFSNVLWPDWNEKHMSEALDFYSLQQRSFGGL